MRNRSCDSCMIYLDSTQNLTARGFFSFNSIPMGCLTAWILCVPWNYNTPNQGAQTLSIYQAILTNHCQLQMKWNWPGEKGQLFGDTNRIERHLLQRLKIRSYTYISPSDTWSYVCTSVSWNEDLAGCARLSQKGNLFRSQLLHSWVWWDGLLPHLSQKVSISWRGQLSGATTLLISSAFVLLFSRNHFCVNNKATRVWRLDG